LALAATALIPSLGLWPLLALLLTRPLVRVVAALRVRLRGAPTG
jgi:hypothetical protein